LVLCVFHGCTEVVVAVGGGGSEKVEREKDLLLPYFPAKKELESKKRVARLQGAAARVRQEKCALCATAELLVEK